MKAMVAPATAMTQDTVMPATVLRGRPEKSDVALDGVAAAESNVEEAPATGIVTLYDVLDGDVVLAGITNAVELLFEAGGSAVDPSVTRFV